MSLLEELVTRQVAMSLTTTLSRTVERIAEELAEEILRDPQFRAQMRTLAQQAFTKALSDLAQ
jgi:hypothetical protein